MFKCIKCRVWKKKRLIIKNLMACLRKVCMVAIKALKVSGAKRKQQEEHFLQLIRLIGNSPSI